MKKALQEAFSFIADSKNPAEMAELLDAYIQMYKKSSSNFIMPQEHQVLQTAVYAFAKDLKVHVAFIGQTRDAVGINQYDGMQLVYRRVNSRLTQIERRRRLKQAISIIEPTLGLQFTFGQTNAVENWLENYWSKERIALLDTARNRGSSIRLSTEERAEICDAFWESVDTQLNNKISPIPPKVVYEQLTAI